MRQHKQDHRRAVPEAVDQNGAGRSARAQAAAAQGASTQGAPAQGTGACEVGHGGRAEAVDPEIKKKNLARLRRIEGQVRGLQAMVEEERYCADVLTQISSVHEALRAVARELMRNHLKHCARAAIQRSPADAESMYDELIDLMHKHSR